MTTRLSDIRPGANQLGEGVSLVHRGANRRRFLLAKADELDTDLAEILAAPVAKEAALLDAVRAAGGDESVEKAAATIARAHAALVDAYTEATPEQQAAIAKAMNDLVAGDTTDDDTDEDALNDDELEKAYEGIAKAEQPVYKRDFTAEQRRELAKKGHALPNGSYPIETKADIGPALTLARSGHGDTEAAKSLIQRRAKELGATDQLPGDWDVSKEDTTMTETTVVPIKKDDGTWDLSGVPDEARASVEAVLKAHDDEVDELRKQADAEKTKADEALQIAKAEQENRLTREYVAKSAELDQLTKADDEFGPVLRDISKAESDGQLPEGTYSKLETVLKAANEQIEKGDLFSETGRTGGHGASDAQTKLDAAAADLRKADTSLSKEQAVAKALENDPNLYVELRKEQG